MTAGPYLLPTSSIDPPGGLTLTQFIQTVLVGISGFTNTLVRPEWQAEPPKRPPSPADDWMAFGIRTTPIDSYAYVQVADDGLSSTLQRQEQVDIEMSVYGANSLENCSKLLDGFQITQNLQNLQLALMGYKGFSPPIAAPDLFDGRWYQRYHMVISLVRQVQRTYSVLSFASVDGNIHTVVGDANAITVPFSAGGD